MTTKEFREVWAVQIVGGPLVCPGVDDDDRTDVVLCWPTRGQAEIGMKFQRENYLPDCKLEVVQLA